MSSPSLSASIVMPVVPSSRQRGKNWMTNQDEQLCKSWLHISQDPVTGNEQHGDSFWAHVFTHFEGSLGETGRNQAALSNRWALISKMVSKFSGFFEQIEARNES